MPTVYKSLSQESVDTRNIYNASSTVKTQANNTIAAFVTLFKAKHT